MNAGPTAVFTDLDRTLIYSARASGRPDVGDLCCVEIYRGEPASFVTPGAAADLRALDAAAVWVPTTTRTVAQYRRVDLPRGRRDGPDRALCANGGVLLVDGRPDPAWAERVRGVVAAAAPAAEVADGFRRRGDALGGGAVAEVRLAEDLFHYAVVDRDRTSDGWLEEFRGWADGLGWRTSLQGSKLYCLPAGLTKAAAARDLARTLGATRVLAAGDSLLDADLLVTADAAIRPRHGELEESGWTAPHVTVTAGTGIAAGEEIAAWLVAARGITPAPPRRAADAGTPGGGPGW